MLVSETPDVPPCVADTVILAMLVDAGQSTLLADLARGRLFVTPGILDPHETPPFDQPPVSEFAKGLYEAQQNLGNPLLARRAQRRTAYYGRAAAASWQPVTLSAAELQLAQELTEKTARDTARAIDPLFRARRLDPGEAECAAVAIMRGWTLWSDDHAIVTLVRTLYPTCTVERLCGLLVRAVSEGLIVCEAAETLYNTTFRRELRLWTTLTLQCERGVASCN